MSFQVSLQWSHMDTGLTPNLRVTFLQLVPTGSSDTLKFTFL